MPHDKKAAPASHEAVSVHIFERGKLVVRDDQVVTERALEIHVAGAQPLITMRTPGDDLALAAGLFYNEGVIASRDDIVYLRHGADEPGVVRLMLKPDARARLDRIERSTYVTSACGVCGKPSFQPPRFPRVGRDSHVLRLSPDLLLGLPHALRSQQGLFSSTGGLHAAGLFCADGTLVDLCEDVGRHNALDKLIGRALRADTLPLSNRILMLSGRTSYELLQKSVMAGLRVVCAISAPSSYAVDLAREHDITLVGFLRDERFNIYSGEQRVVTMVANTNEERSPQMNANKRK